jgi:hypothetical protein
MTFPQRVYELELSNGKKVHIFSTYNLFTNVLKQTPLIICERSKRSYILNNIVSFKEIGFMGG